MNERKKERKKRTSVKTWEMTKAITMPLRNVLPLSWHGGGACFS